MATAEGGRSPYASGGAGEKLRKRPFRPEIYEEPPNGSHEAGQNKLTGASEVSTHHGGNFASISVTVGKSELEQMLKQMTFTRSETQHLISLLHSRTIEESPTPLLSLEASTTGLVKRHKHGDERDNFHASVVGSRVLEEEIATPAELANAYKDSTIGNGQALRQDAKLINNYATDLPLTSMASPQHPATMENLSDELLLNIFIRLLAKQLAQMRSVSKSWNALLSQPSFVKSHLHRSLHDNDQILLLIYEGESKPLTAHPSRSPHLELTDFIKLPVNPQAEYKGIKVIGSVNGLICSSYDNDYVVHIWNPSLSSVLTLPPYPTPSNNSTDIKLRFGFDPKTDDYKVVKFTNHIGPPAYLEYWWPEVEIYSMKKGSWELINESFPSHITRIFNDDGVCVDGHDGHLHWLVNTSLKIDSQRILTFDLGSEKFHEIPLPHSILEYHRRNLLGVLAGKLCVMSWGENVGCEVWVIDKYAVAKSWVKHHVFSQFTTNSCPYGFISYNEFLFKDACSLVLYDTITNKEKRFKSYSPKHGRPRKIVKYVDSLVWVAPAGHEIVDGAGQN